MLRRSTSTLLTLSLAFPAASWALGLGDIHVRSALDQPLEAQIELIGATPGDTAILTARILGESEFRQHGLEWPSFLAGSTLTVGKDDQGTPALIVHSIEKVAEPLVTLLVGVDSPSGQLIREYTVLLDPVDRVPRTRTPDAAITPTVAAETSSPALPAVAQASPPSADLTRANAGSDGNRSPRSQLYTVATHDTLDRIAHNAGAVSKSELRRMEIAIYRTNPNAFRANLNLLRRGATLRLPSAEQLTAISAQDAAREYVAQMEAWQAGVHRMAPAAARISPPTSSAAFDSTTRGGESDEIQVRLLTEQVQSLERSLNDLQEELKRPIAMPATTSVGASSTGAGARTQDSAQVDTKQARPAPAGVTNARPESRDAGKPLAPLAALVICGSLVLLGGIWLRRRRQTEESPPRQSNTERDSTREAGWFNTASRNPVDDLSGKKPAASRGEPDHAAAHPTVKLSMPSAGATLETAALLAEAHSSDDTEKFTFFDEKNLEDTTHVVMSNGLSEAAPFVERRKTPAEVLRQAIEREPYRNDLRLKLLELYYTGAAQNQRAFLDSVRELAKKEGLVSAEDWSRIMDMGRAIAPEDELFTGDKGSKAVA